MKRVLLVILLIGSTGCASTSTFPTARPAAHRDTLSMTEIDSYRTPGMTAYDLIAHLRPEFLKNRGINSFREKVPRTATVYLNGSPYGSIDALKSLNAGIVTGVRYLSAASATSQFGMDQTGGAILVSTR